MKTTDFQSGFPGRLARAAFEEHGPDGKVRESTGQAFVPDALQAVLERFDQSGLRAVTLGRLFDVHDRAKTALLKLEAAVSALPTPAVVLQAMRAREAQSSSKIENTVASLGELALSALDPAKARPEAIEVMRNKQAIIAGAESELPICTRLACEMHRVLVVHRSHRPGLIRDRQVFIGNETSGFAGARFVPPPPGEIEQCLKAWELFENPDARNAAPRERWPDLIELALSHYQFETIHPFSDGNGRVGRALVNVAPMKRGWLKYPICNLSEWINDHRQEYYDRLLAVSTRAEWEQWVTFFCTAVAEQATLDLRRAQRVAAVYAQCQKLVASKPRSGLTTLKLVNHLFNQQSVTIPEAAQVMGVSYPAAQRHVEFLEREKVIREFKGKQEWGKWYIAYGIITAIRGDGDE